MASEAMGDGDLTHLAQFYRDQDSYLAHIQAFARDALDSAEPVFLSVRADRADLLRTQLGSDAADVSYGDRAELGRNPGRIIPAVQAFAEAHPGRRVRYLSEPIWPGRSAAETCEATRHEALFNLAFFGVPVTMMCLYDEVGLTAAALSAARYTHPEIMEDGKPLASGEFTGPGALPPECDQPLPPPPAHAEVLHYGTDLAALRRLVTAHAERAGLAGERVADLVLAASELGANTLQHATGSGVLQIWHTEREILCQVRDQGWIIDPLAGRRASPADQTGHGLWVVNQVCDLVEMRSGETGTTIRMHMFR